MPARAGPLNLGQLHAPCLVTGQRTFMAVFVAPLLDYHCFVHTGVFMFATVGQITFATCGSKAITSPARVAMLRWFVKHGQPGDRRWLWAGPQFRAVWTQLVAAKGLNGFFQPAPRPCQQQPGQGLRPRPVDLNHEEEQQVGG